MKCIVCGSHGSRCQEMRKPQSSFHNNIGKNSMMVPCFVRRQFNNLVGNIFDAVAPDGKEYRFNVKKSDYKTSILGTAYQEIIRDYNMYVGDRIRLKWDHSGQFGVFPECDMGTQLNRVQESSEHFEENATVVVYSNGIKPSTTNLGRMNEIIAERGLGMGAVLVHKLTNTDMSNTGLRIPKEIAKALKFAKNGWVILQMGNQNNKCQAEYVTSTDGRMRIKSGWGKFVTDHGLKASFVVLIMFYMGHNRFVNISLDVL